MSRYFPGNEISALKYHDIFQVWKSREKSEISAINSKISRDDCKYRGSRLKKLRACSINEFFRFLLSHFGFSRAGRLLRTSKEARGFEGCCRFPFGRCLIQVPSGFNICLTNYNIWLCLQYMPCIYAEYLQYMRSRINIQYTLRLKFEQQNHITFGLYKIWEAFKMFLKSHFLLFPQFDASGEGWCSTKEPTGIETG